MKARTPLLIALILVLSAAPLLSQTRPGQTRPRRSRFSFITESAKKGGDVKVEALHQELVKEGVSILTGKVRIEYQDIKVSADTVIYDSSTQDITAEGNVVIDQGTQRLSADQAKYNLTTKTGTLTKAKASIEPDIYFTGEKLEKLDENTYRLTHGVLTSCDIADPDWSFHVGSGTVTIDDYARLRNISFFAERLPVFWMPYLVWPTKRDRARGFLIPRVGSNQDFGSYIENSYFIPIGSSMDATLRADFYSEGAMRSGAIFRYVPTPSASGRFEGYFVHDPDREKVEWKYAYQHTQEGFPGGFRAVIDIKDFSNLDFFKRFEREFELRTISSIYSSAYLTKNRPQYSLNIRADRREHFLPSIAAFQRSVVFEQVPSIQYTIYPTRLGTTPIYYALESSAVQLRRKERQLGGFLSSEYVRGDFFPTLSMQLKTPPWISVKPTLSVRETYYNASVDPATREIVDDSLSRRYAQGQVEFVGPSLSRIYNRGFRDFAKFKHVIEPRARYLYTTEVDNQNRVIQFDTVDSPFLPLVRDSIEYSLTQRLLAKQKGESSSAREIMSVSLRQSVSLSEPFRRTGTREHRFTPISLNVRVNPYQSVTFDANASYGNISHQLDQLNISTNLRSKERYLNLTWFASFLQPGRTTGDSSQFRVSVGAPIWKQKLRGDIHLSYDAERKQFLERRYSTLFTAACFGITLEAREFLELRGFEGARATRDYQITIDLKNVGPLRGSF